LCVSGVHCVVVLGVICGLVVGSELFGVKGVWCFVFGDGMPVVCVVLFCHVLCFHNVNTHTLPAENTLSPCTWRRQPPIQSTRKNPSILSKTQNTKHLSHQTTHSPPLNHISHLTQPHNAHQKHTTTQHSSHSTHNHKVPNSPHTDIGTLETHKKKHRLSKTTQPIKKNNTPHGIIKTPNYPTQNLATLHPQQGTNTRTCILHMQASPTPHQETLVSSAHHKIFREEHHHTGRRAHIYS